MTGFTLRLTVRTLVPIDPEPAQPIQHGQFRLMGRSFEVRVLDPQYEFAAEATREGPIEERGASTANM
jgi:hypothetical protein